MKLSSPQLSSLVALFALLTIPGLVWFAAHAPTTWQDRLTIPSFEVEPDRHTRQQLGTFLPTTISQDRTIAPADGAFIVAGSTTITPGATLTITPGTTIFFQEFATLVVAGELSAQGTAAAPIVLTSHELHPDNQVWAGVEFRPGSTGRLAYLDVSFASPGISCDTGSTLDATDLRIRSASVGLFTRSATCRLTASRIAAERYGVVAIGEAALVTDSVITADQPTLTVPPGP